VSAETRRLAIAALVVGSIAVAAFYARGRSSLVRAAWPTAAVRLLTPNAAGGGPDFAIRLMSAALAERWQHPVIVDNRPGAEGIMAVRAMIDADDDHTMMVAPISVATTNFVVRKSLPYSIDDLAPITTLFEVPIAVVVGHAFKAASIRELVAIASAESPRLSYTTVFGAPQVLWRAFERQAGIEMLLVGYRNPNEALPDLLEGRVHVALLPLGTVIPQVRAGNLRILALLDGQRSGVVPEIPTLAEAGYPELWIEGALGLFSARRMNTERRDWIHREVSGVLEGAVVQRQLLDAGFDVATSSPAEFAKTLGEHRTRLRLLIMMAEETR
jgi:tripartite-type tricarboxylate transporter receptor subunit TctC